MKRRPVFVIIAGTNGTGKTTLLRKLIKERRALVLDPDGAEWLDLKDIEMSQARQILPGKQARVITPEIEDLELLGNFDTFNNGALVLDDCKHYVKHTVDMAIRKTLIRRRQRRLDIFAVTHSLADVPPTFWTYHSHLILFKTSDSLTRAQRNIPNAKKLQQQVEQVNRHPNPHYHRYLQLGKL